MVYGSNRAYFYTALAVLVVLMCACFWAFRYYRQRIDATDQRTPYEIWVDYHEAKRTGADYVPPQHVANPLPPQTVLPGYSDPDKHASTFRRASMRMLGFGRPISGTNLRPANGTSRLDPSQGADASIYDASGTNARVSEMGLHDLYGRRSEGLATLGARAAPTAMRNLDRLDDAYSSANGMGAAGHNNPADLTTLENDPQVTAATAMALAAQQISSTKKKASNTFAAYNPLIVGMGNVERDRGGKRASTATSTTTTSPSSISTGALTMDPIPRVVDTAATATGTSSTNTNSSSTSSNVSSSTLAPDGSSFLVSSPVLSATTTAQEYSPRPASMIRPHSVLLLSSRGAAGGGPGSGGAGGGAGGRGFSQLSEDRRGSSKRLQLSPQAAPGASTSYPVGTPLQSLESLAVAARLSTIHFHEEEEEGL